MKMIEFSPVVLKEIDNFNTTGVCENALAISVRTWKCKHEKNIKRKYNFETYREKILDVLEKTPTINKIIISLDNHDVENDYIELCKSQNKEYIILKKPEILNELQYVLYKVMILSKCCSFIGNRISTYSELVFWFSECKIKVHPLF